MTLISRQVGPWSLNAYVLVCDDSRRSVLVDPGAEPEKLQKMVDGTRPEAILVTHSHPDHIGALAAMRKQLQVPVMAHAGKDAGHSPVQADRWLAHGEEIEVGHQRLLVYHTPGHTDDQICFAVRNRPEVIVGDTIFEGGPGKTWSADDFRQTLKTLRDTVLQWPDETICHPGHGPCFRLGSKRRAVELFLEKDHGDFFGDAVW